MLIKHNDKILCLLANGFDINEILKSGINYIKENYLLLKLSGIVKPIEGDLKFYIKSSELNLIFCRSAKYNYFNIVKYLVNQGINVHVWCDYALRWSARNGHLKIVKYLISKGADIHANNNEALQWSIENGRLRVSEYLKTVEL